MIYNKKGVSTIVITVIMVALVLVAVGVVWAVLSGVIGGGAKDIEWSAKCLATNLEIRPTALSCSGTPITCDVTLERTGTGNDVITGVKLVFKDTVAGTSSNIVLKTGDVPKLTGKILGDVDPYEGTGETLVTTPNKVEVTAYFTDAGEDHLCPTTMYP